MSDSRAILQNIGSQPGVLGTVVLANSTGIPITSSLSAADAAQYAALVTAFISRSWSILSELVQGQPLQVVRVRTFKNELIIIPDHHITLVIIQDAVVAA
jgi:dynein light chain roadblock-type